MRMFILGAGASMHAGYPPLRRLGPELLGRIEARQRMDPPMPVLCDVHAGVLRRHFGSFEDLEGIMTELRWPEKNTALFQISEVYRTLLFNGLIEEIIDYFHAIFAAHNAHLYKMFAMNVVRPNDVIVTFNYDVALESELRSAGRWEVSTGYGFRVNIPDLAFSPTTVLKLHGSTNWIDVLFEGQSGYFATPNSQYGPRPWIPPEEMSRLGYSIERQDLHYSEPVVDRGRSLIAPTLRKFLWPQGLQAGDEARVFWDGQWEQASKALAGASEVTIIGYSLPTADDRARKAILYGTGRAASVTVCCGPDSMRIRGELAEAGLNVSLEAPSNFEDWLESQVRSGNGRKGGQV